jgi:hypothetical protein
MSMIGKSVSNADFSAKGGGSREKRLSTTARDNPDTVSPENKLQQYVGKSGKPSGELGLKGRGF